MLFKGKDTRKSTSKGKCSFKPAKYKSQKQKFWEEKFQTLKIYILAISILWIFSILNLCELKENDLNEDKDNSPH